MLALSMCKTFLLVFASFGCLYLLVEPVKDDLVCQSYGDYQCVDASKCRISNCLSDSLDLKNGKWVFSLQREIIEFFLFLSM